jgi:glycosyltransferase involved in cell wall biosynthesis
MKILQVNKYYPPVIGGVEKVVYDIATGLQDRVDMKVLVSNNSMKLDIDVHEGIEVYRIPSLGKYFSMPVSPTLPLWLNRLKHTDIMHFHFPFPLGELSRLLVPSKSKTIVTWHSDIVKQKTFLRLYDPFLRKFLRSVDKIVATSPDMVEHSSYLREFKDKCEVIPLGIDTKPFEGNPDAVDKARGEVRKKLGEKPVILFIGRMVYYKGVEYLLKAMTSVDATLVLIGDGALREQLQGMAAQLGLTNKVKFMGRLDDDEIVSYLHAADLFVLPSIERSEAFGLVQLEAMACGKPVISTNLTTGVPYVNKHHETGIVVPPRDADAISRAINQLLHNPQLMADYGRNAKNRVLDMFTKQRMVDKYLELYQGLLD